MASSVPSTITPARSSSLQRPQLSAKPSILVAKLRRLLRNLSRLVIHAAATTITPFTSNLPTYHSSQTNGLPSPKHPLSSSSASSSRSASSRLPVRRLRALTVFFIITLLIAIPFTLGVASTTRAFWRLLSTLLTLNRPLYFHTLPPTYTWSHHDSPNHHHHPLGASHAASTSQSPVHIRLLIPPFSHYTPNYTPTSLQTLLTSLRRATYLPAIPVHLHILLLPHANQTSFNTLRTSLTSFHWPHGNTTIRNATSGAPFASLLSLWPIAPSSTDPTTTEHSSTNSQTAAKASTPHVNHSPITDDDTSIAVLLDASRHTIPLPSTWLRYLNHIRTTHSHRADIAAYSLIPPKLKNPLPLPTATEHPLTLLYQGIPSPETPIIPSSPRLWSNFLTWFLAHRAEWFLWPAVVNPKDKKDGAWGRFQGNMRAHWTLWFSRFVSVQGLYVMYPRVPLDDARMLASLPANFSARGVAGHMGTDASLRWGAMFGRGEALPRFAFNGKRVKKGSSLARVDDENIDRIVALGRHYSNVVSLTVVNEAFLETARSWVCNVDVVGIRPPGVVWIATDEVAYNGLKDINGSYAVHLRELRGGLAGTSYGTPGYWLLMLERTALIRDVLEHGIAVFAFETDQVWLRDPVPYVRRLVTGGEGVDIVGTLDTRHEIGGNFLFLNPTLATRRVWREVCRRFEGSYLRHGMQRHTAKYKRYIENDQSTLTKLVFYDKTFLTRAPVVFRALDTELFVDGRWYEGGGKFYRSARARSPIMVNNNFMVGIENKKKRLEKHGHWFLKGGVCFAEGVRRAVRENEQRAVKAGVVLEGLVSAGAAVGEGRPLTVQGSDVEAKMEMAVEAITKEVG